MTSEELLERRARELARPLAPPSPSAPTTVLSFRCAEERYAVRLGEARQVVSLEGMARLPRAAHPVVALVALGGGLVPVVELGTRTGERVDGDLPEWGVAVAAGGAVVVIPADEVSGVTEVGDHQITPVGGDEATVAAVLRGVTTDGDGLIDVGRLIDGLRDQAQGPAIGHGRTDQGIDR